MIFAMVGVPLANSVRGGGVVTAYVRYLGDRFAPFKGSELH